MMLDVVGEVLFFGIPVTPLLGWLMVRRKTHWSAWEKLMAVLLIASVLSLFFFFIALAILFRDGLGPG